MRFEYDFRFRTTTPGQRYCEILKIIVESAFEIINAKNSYRNIKLWTNSRGEMHKMCISPNQCKNMGHVLLTERTHICKCILIIHVSECISGSATCIEDIYNVANRTRRLCRRVWFAKHCECPKSCCTAANA